MAQEKTSSVEVMPGVLQAKEAPMSLGARLVKAQGIAQAVAKDSFNSFQRYKYASSEAIIEEARGALTQAGLALYSSGWHFCGAGENMNPPPESEKGGRYVGHMLVDYQLTDGVSGVPWTFQVETAVIVERGRPLDKAQATALTYNLAYFLRSLLLLPREDEGDSVDARDDRHQDHPATRQQAPQREEEPSYSSEDISKLHVEIKALGAELGFKEPAALHKHLSGLALGKPYSANYPLLVSLKNMLSKALGKP